MNKYLTNWVTPAEIISRLIKSVYVIAVFFIILTLHSCSFTEGDSITTVQKVEATAIIIETDTVPPEPLKVTISAVGDIMVHQTQINAQRTTDTTYDFTNNFKFVNSFFKQADLMMGNLETTFAGPEKGYSGYPKFNAPDALAEALKSAGFHLLSTANNHLYDMGGDGMLRTIDVLEQHQLLVTGTRKDTNQHNFVLTEINGVQVGVTAFTYASPEYNGHKTINGLLVQPEHAPLINSFDYEKLEEGIAEMKATADSMRAGGAELMVFNVHWGNEYKQQPNHFQKEIADSLNRFGVDIIFGSHPHVIQPVQFIHSSVDSHLTLVAYSLGNFISNQRYETLQMRLVEDGVILYVTAEKDVDSPNARIKAVSYTPTWVHRYYVKGKPVYEIVPVVEAIKDPEAYNIHNEILLNRIQQSFRQTSTKIESHIEVPDGIDFEYLTENFRPKE